MSPVKVVILHDWLTGFRGGERLLEVFCEIFPDAPIYTLLHKPGSTSEIIESRTIHTSFLDKIPGIHSQYRKFLPLFPRAAERLKIDDDVDLVFTSHHCVVKGVKKPPGARHIAYINSPMRYLYDQFDVYFGPAAPFYQRWGMKLFKNYLTRWDKASNANVDVPIANSGFIKQRIARFYGIDSMVIHPFVDLADFKKVGRKKIKKEDYFVMVTGFAPNKRVDLAIEAANRLGISLKIVGGGQQEKLLREMANDNVEFLGNLDRAGVIDALARAQALIFPGIEDFGITPLEALASGTPVIAYKAGGVLETLNNRVALFFEHDTVDDLCRAIEKFDPRKYKKSAMAAQAKKFSKEKFVREINAIVKKTMR